MGQPLAGATWRQLQTEHFTPVGSGAYVNNRLTVSRPDAAGVLLSISSLQSAYDTENKQKSAVSASAPIADCQFSDSNQELS